ncbi:MAG: amino acid permease [Planctomycetaceae bacterium]|nr:amino acid permease [Planctomycetaceae bacterium]
MSWLHQLFWRQRPPGGIEQANPPPRVLGAWGLTAMGIGATIGAGIFVTAGQVARDDAGPAVILSFVVSGFACAMAGLCYAEFAALAPTGGSAYSYAYATMGELLAWIIGWDLVLEYAFAGSIVAVEWASNLSALLAAMGMQLPHLGIPVQWPGQPWTVEPFNYLAVLIMVVITVVLVRGVEESARMNSLMVGVKVCVVMFVILAGVWFITPSNWVGVPPPNNPGGSGFMPFGWTGVMAGAAIVFFSYIGFDAVSTHAEETHNPGKNLPIGILASLVICTILYMGVAIVLTGMVPWPEMAAQAPVVNAFVMQGGWLAKVAGIVIGIGALAGMTSVLLVTFSGQARIFRSMARDGLLPEGLFAAEHPQFRSPHRSLILTGTVAAAIAAFVPAEELLNMVAIGTLLAFALVCAAVMILRNTDPEHNRPFRCPFVYVIAPLGIVANVAMMFSLNHDAWIRLGVWLVIGMVVYFTYGRRHSVVRRLREAATDANTRSA